MAVLSPFALEQKCQATRPCLVTIQKTKDGLSDPIGSVGYWGIRQTLGCPTTEFDWENGVQDQLTECQRGRRFISGWAYVVDGTRGKDTFANTPSPAMKSGGRAALSMLPPSTTETGTQHRTWRAGSCGAPRRLGPVMKQCLACGFSLGQRTPSTVAACSSTRAGAAPAWATGYGAQSAMRSSRSIGSLDERCASTQVFWQ